MGEGVDPTQMCQSLVDKVAQSEQLMAITDPDLLALFEDWLGELEAEVLSMIKKYGLEDEQKLSNELGLSSRGVTFLVSKLRRKKKYRFDKLLIKGQGMLGFKEFLPFEHGGLDFVLALASLCLVPTLEADLSKTWRVFKIRCYRWKLKHLFAWALSLASSLFWLRVRFSSPADG
jgi:hypothetical protein